MLSHWYATTFVFLVPTYALYIMAYTIFLRGITYLVDLYLQLC